MSDAPLPASPAQPAGVPWPTTAWPEGTPAAGVDASRLGALLAGVGGPDADSRFGTTHAVVAVHRGVLVAERYGAGVDAGTTLASWSMAKSILHALVGVLVGRGALDPAARTGLAAWSGVDDARAAITLDDLLSMRPGLAWLEDYVPGHDSDVQTMLFGDGRDDVAAYAAARPLAHPPGTRFCYSSGTSNLVSAMTAAVVGPPPAYEAFMRDALFDPLGMQSPVPKFDPAGTWIASSYCFATARDFARFGLLYARDGVWEGERLLPEGWVDRARRPQPDVDDEGWGYGAHWWVLPGRTDGLFFASGYGGQYLMVVPEHDLVLVRCGQSTTAQRDAVLDWLLDIVTCFA